MRFTLVLALVCSVPSFAAGVLWNGFCRGGVFAGSGITCSTAAKCQLKMRQQGGVALVGQIASANQILAADVPSGVSEWFYEVGGVAVSDTLTIDSATQCAN